MAARTLNTFWKQIEKLAHKILEAKSPKPFLKPLDDLCQKTNESKIVDALASLLVSPYLGMEGVVVRFAMSNGTEYPEWITFFNAEEKVIYVNPVGVFRFRMECQKAIKSLKTASARESFPVYRLQAFLAELHKLPSRLLLFLVILKQVAVCKEVCRAEKRSTGSESPETDEYLNLLWGFKEMENFYSSSTGINLRSEHNILWYESEWIAGK